MANLDRVNKFHEFSVTTNSEKQAYIEVTPTRDGGLSIMLEESRIKFGGKKWHTTLGHIVLTPDQRAALKEIL